MSKYGYAVNGNGLNPSTEPVQETEPVQVAQQLSVEPWAVYGRLNVVLEKDRAPIQLKNYTNDGSRLGITSDSPVLSSVGGVYPNPEIRLYKDNSGNLALGIVSTYHQGLIGYAPLLNKDKKPIPATPENVRKVGEDLSRLYGRHGNYINGTTPRAYSSNLQISDIIAQLQRQIGPKLQELIAPNTPQNQQENQAPQKQQENEVDFELA